MSRSGYTDNCDDTLALGRWRAQVASATRGKRGQAFFRNLVDALEAMPQKRLIKDSLRQPGGEVCAIGALGAKMGVDLESLDPEDGGAIGEAFGIAPQLAQEVAFENDESCDDRTPEERWERMHAWAKQQLITSAAS